MSVSEFAYSLSYAVISVLPYVVVYRLVDIIFCSIQRAVFDGKLSFRGHNI